MRWPIGGMIWLAGCMQPAHELIAQSPDFLWAKSINSIGENFTSSMAIDQATGNVYLSGSLYGTADFDPGPDTFYLSANGGFIAKQNEFGHFLWALAISNLEVRSIALDPLSGDICAAGWFSGTVDFDPGPDSFYMTTQEGADIFVLRLDQNGYFVWAKSMGGTGQDQAFAIALDPVNGDICTTGWFGGTADFDPGPDSFLLTSVSNYWELDIFISRLNTDGQFVWAGALNGPETQLVTSIAIDPVSREICTTGRFGGTVDFDPGPDEHNLTSVVEDDVFISKLDWQGQFVWAKSLGGEDLETGMDIMIDPSGRGDVYTIGSFEDVVDFDPGAGVYNLSPVGSLDMFISKLDASGNFVWARNIGGTCVVYGQSVWIEAETGDVYTTGSFCGTTDFDPGAASYEIGSIGSADVFISKLSSGGQFIWAKSAGGIHVEWGRAIAQSASNEVYVAGDFTSLEAYFDMDTLRNSDTTVYYDDFDLPYYSFEIFVAKLNICNTVVINTDDHGPGSLRDIIACSSSGGNITFALSPMSQITLTSGEILIDKNLTISGPGMDELSISGNNLSRIFNLQPGHTLTLKNLTILDAYSPTNGGAIFVKGDLRLENILLQNNFENTIPKSMTLISPGALTIDGNVILQY